MGRESVGGGVVRSAQKCVVIAHPVHEIGRRTIIGLDISATETEAFSTALRHSLIVATCGAQPEHRSRKKDVAEPPRP